MKFRALDQSGDWTFGRGSSNYLQATEAVAANIRSRLASFLGDCFFDASSGIDWLNLLGTNNETAILYSTKTTILETPGVASLTQLRATRDAKRNLAMSYDATTNFGSPVNQSMFEIPASPFVGISKFLLDLSFNGQANLEINVSSRIYDARKAVWMLYEVANGYSPVLGAVQPLNDKIVRVTMNPVPAGIFRLVGIS